MKKVTKKSLKILFSDIARMDSHFLSLRLPRLAGSDAYSASMERSGGEASNLKKGGGENGA